MLKNQNSIQLNSFNSVYDEVFIRGKENSVVLAGTLVNFLDEAYEYRDTDYFATKYNEGIATADYDVPEIETTDTITVLYKGTPYEQVKHETTQTQVTKHYTANYDIASFSPAVIIENSLIGKSLNHQNFRNVYARCRRLVPGDKFLLRAVADTYNFGDPLYAVQTDNGIYVTKEQGGMFIGWCEENYTITDDMVDLVDTYEFPETTGSLRGALVNLLAVRVGVAYAVKVLPVINGLSVTQTTTTMTYDGQEHPITEFVQISGVDTGTDTVIYKVDKILSGTEIPSIQFAGKYKVVITVKREGYQDYVSEPFTVTINKRQLTVSGSSVADKDYDGTTNAVVTIGNVDNFAEDESFDVIAIGTFASASVGENINVRVVYSIPQAYRNDYIAPATETLTASINSVVLPEITGLTLSPLSNIRYNGEDQNVASLIAGNYVVGDKVTYSPNTVKNAGTYNIDVTVERSGYQTYTTSVQLVVGKAEIVVSNVSVKNKEFDGTTTAELNSYNVTGIYDGFELEVTANFNNPTPENGKSVVVNFAIPSAYLDNYYFQIGSSQFNVTANITPVPTGDEDLEGITVTGLSVPYTGSNINPENAVNIEGVETTDIISYNSSTIKSIGEYEIEVTVERDGYNPYTTTVTATVTRKAITVTGTTISNKTYDETTDATINLGTVDGIVGNDDVTVVPSGSFPSANPGTYDVQVTYTISGADSGNYFAPSSDTVSATINEVVAPTYTYAAVANGGPTETTTEIAVSLVGDDPSLYPAYIPYANIEIGGDAVLNTNEENCPASMGVLTIPVRMLKSFKDEYEITIKITADNQDKEIKPIPAYFMAGYWGTVVTDMEDSNLPAASQILSLNGLGVVKGVKYSPVSCRFAIDPRDWGVFVQENNLTGEDANLEENGGGREFFVTCWDTSITGIENESNIPQYDIDPAKSGFVAYSVTINGIVYSGVISKNWTMPTGNSIYEISLS